MAASIVSTITHFLPEKPVEVYCSSEIGGVMESGYYNLVNVNFCFQNQYVSVYRIKIEYGYTYNTLIIVVDKMNGEIRSSYEEDSTAPVIIAM